MNHDIANVLKSCPPIYKVGLPYKINGGYATDRVVQKAYKAAFNSESKAKREVEDKLEKLKEEFDKDKHNLENQIITLRVSGCLAFKPSALCFHLGIRAPCNMPGGW